MAPRKVSDSVEEDEQEEPLDFVEHIRKKGQQRFAITEENVTYDYVQNVREIKALLTINAEIFGRVMGSSCSSSGACVTLKRYGFELVKVHQNDFCLTEFITEATSSEEVFNVEYLLQLPSDLDGVFVVKYMTAPNQKFIDYNAFFLDALMLHDDILGPLLVKLKLHIESIHVLLGRMERWLLEAQRKVEFINSTFGTELETETLSADTINDVEKSNCRCPYGSHRMTKCLACGKGFDAHGKKEYGDYYTCPYGPYETRKSPRCEKITPKKYVLKTYEDSGRFEKTFDIASDKDQRKLKKFLEWIES